MPTLAIRAGIIALAHDMNVAAVGQVILNRVLAANSSDVSVDDVAKICGLSLDDTRAALVELQRLGLLNVGTDDMHHVDKLKPSGLVLQAEVVQEASLFSGSGMTSDGTPSMMQAPVYIAGWWYKARVAERSGQHQLVVERCSHGDPWVSVFDQIFDSEAAARQALLDYADGLADDQPASLVYKGKVHLLNASSREHDGETMAVLDLQPDGGGTPVNTTTGETLNQCYALMLSWHKKLSDPSNVAPAPKRGRKKAGA